MDGTVILINEFISDIKKQFPSLHIDYEYDPETNEYDIWHNNEELEFRNEKFVSYIGDKAEEILFKNDIYNFSFGYDYCKAKEFGNKIGRYTLYKTELSQLEYEYTEIVDSLNYDSNVNSDLNLPMRVGSVKVSFDCVVQKSQKQYFSKIVFPQNNIDFLEESMFNYNEFREAS